MRIDHLKRMVKLQAESFEEIERKFEETNVQYLPTILPVHQGRTWRSSSFGWRIDPFTGRRAFHSGVDFAGRKGMPIYATADGFVSYAAKDKYFGNMVIIEHRKKELDEQGQPYVRQGGYQTEYGHLEKIMVKQGQQIKRGQQIGTMATRAARPAPTCTTRCACETTSWASTEDIRIQKTSSSTIMGTICGPQASESNASLADRMVGANFYQAYRDRSAASERGPVSFLGAQPHEYTY